MTTALFYEDYRGIRMFLVFRQGPRVRPRVAQQLISEWFITVLDCRYTPEGTLYLTSGVKEQLT